MPQIEFAAGVDLGGTHYAVGIVDTNGTILAKQSRTFDPSHIGADRPFEAIIAEIAETVVHAAKQAALNPAQLAGTGFGVPSTIDPHTKKMIFANNLGWQNLDLAAEYGRYFSGPVYIENDAACAALGEVLTGPYSASGVLMVTFGTGFGGGLIINGKIFRGCDGFGIEPGHMVLVYGGRECNCGNRGCVEAYASVTALVERSREKMIACPESLMWETCADPLLADGRTPFTAAKKGDKAALEVLAEFTALAGQATANLITLFRPEQVIIGGGICNEGDFFIRPLFEAAKAHIFGSGLMPMPPFSKARLGGDAGIVGAALLAIKKQC